MEETEESKVAADSKVEEYKQIIVVSCYVTNAVHCVHVVSLRPCAWICTTGSEYATYAAVCTCSVCFLRKEPNVL